MKVTGPVGVLLAGNSSANLSCWADAGEVLSVTWKKDGQVLTAGGRVVFTKDMKSIVIDPLQKEDNGEYTCQLSNPVSNGKASYKMVVNCECQHQRRRRWAGLAAQQASNRKGRSLLWWTKNQDVKV